MGANNKKLTTAEFIEKARTVHGARYGYELVVYVNAQGKVRINCPEHGVFEQAAISHAQGRGCTKCGYESNSRNLTHTLLAFLARARKAHGNRYDYSLVVYAKSEGKINIICPDHGEFEQIANSHLQGAGCPICAGNLRLNITSFLARAREIHGDKYDYSQVVCKGSKDKIKIICPEHGLFKQATQSHLRGIGCPQCGIEQAKLKRTKDTAWFVEAARKAHGNRYDYSLVVYVRSAGKLTIICPDHGKFKQNAGSHYRGQGCPSCGGVAKLDTASFVSRAREIHGDKYDYSGALYSGNNKRKLTIICPEHGPFQQAPNSHLSGCGCKACAGLAPLTQADFLTRARAAHGDKYDYSQAVYRGAARKAKIFCPEHGPFEQVVGHHMRGIGCPACGGLSAAQSRSLSFADFLARAREAHGERYDYSAVEYGGAQCLVTIICPEHGPFEQRPVNHAGQRQGCPSCGTLSAASLRRLKPADFIARAETIHSFRYDYSQVVHSGNNRQKVQVVCPAHGAFEQTIGSHLSGQGCPTCGRERTREAQRRDWTEGALGQLCTLYFLCIRSDSEQFYKVGITKYSVKHRYRQASSLNGYQYEVLAIHRSDAARVWDWEQSILETFTRLKYTPKKRFIGETECFSSCDEILAIFPL